jgi:hypothetical protein
VLDGKFDSNQVADNAHAKEAKLRILLSLGEFNRFLEACPAEFLELVALLLGWKPGNAYGHVVGEDEAFDSAVKIPVCHTAWHTHILPSLGQIGNYQGSNIRGG